MGTMIPLIARFEPTEEKVWKHIPFTVPEGVKQFHISVTYNDRIDSSPTLTGGNTLDIGLFDAQGIESGSPGLRGWSGSNKTEITIGEAWSTPPYRAGALQPGEWHLLLGAYKTSVNGLTAEVTIELDSTREAWETPPTPEIGSLTKGQLPAPVEPNWVRGDLHMHTIYSDGDSYPHELTVRAYELGLDFYGITDHNRAQSPVPLVPHGHGWPVLVPGVEVTSYAGHFNVWGGPDTWYDFRDYSAAGQQAAVNAARADGALVSMNHPKPYGPMWDHPDITGFECTEPWNGWWAGLNSLATEFWVNQLNSDTTGSWHIGICGSDTHYLKRSGDPRIPLSPARMGTPTLWLHIEDELTPATIIAAIRAGTGFMSESPEGPQLIVSANDDVVRVHVAGAVGDALIGLGNNGAVLAEPITADDEIFQWHIGTAIPAGNSYIRFEIHKPGGNVRALSNPVWR
ncbi:MAG: CehA/McbA family metallohydrolase [Thermomicrobiales bacterium]|nr:CehA/McbA family metallohydrolase [Thermomicrobiales bacterium]